MCPQDGVTIEQKNSQKPRILASSVPDPWHFGVRIRGPVQRTSRFGSGSCSMTFKMPTKIYFFLSFSSCYFLKIHLYHSLHIKSHKQVKNSKNQGVSFYFCLMGGSGSVTLTNGSGRPKTLRIKRNTKPCRIFPPVWKERRERKNNLYILQAYIDIRHIQNIT